MARSRREVEMSGEITLDFSLKLCYNSIMEIGFTGTQKGMTDEQKETLRLIFEAGFIFHHGDCVGADAEAHEIASEFTNAIFIHPPINNKKRAYCEGTILESKDYLERNHDIVDACELLIVCPKQNKEVLRSGTWATFRYARKNDKRVYVIRPNGYIIVYEPWN